MSSPAVQPEVLSPAASAERDASTAARRLVAGVLLFAGSVVLLIAAWLEPAAQGHGTHTQIGLPACDWVARFGMPCPTCGMTTAFAHAAEGNFAASFVAQPMGFTLALATAAMVLISGYVVWTGSPVGRVFARMWSNRMLVAFLALLLGSWLYKILHFKGFFG